MSGGSEGLDKLRGAGGDLLRNLGDRALDTVNDKVSGLTERFSEISQGGEAGGAAGKVAAGAGKAAAEGDNPVMGGLKGAAKGLKDKVTGGGGGGGGKATSSTNIIETVDVGVPLRVAYNQWTQFGDFPDFMKKVESVEAKDEHKLAFKAQIFLSHRTWEATIKQQVPDEQIVWRSSGEKGHVDGAVTFHELAPSLTRILLVLEYYPQGLFEKTGNLWRAQGRRARAELRHFRRHVMTRTILDPDSVEGWRGTIEDGEVVESHEDALEREEQEQQDGQEQDGQEQDGEEQDGEEQDGEEQDGEEYEDAEGYDEEPEEYEDAEEPEAEEYEEAEDPEEESAEEDEPLDAEEAEEDPVEDDEVPEEELEEEEPEEEEPEEDAEEEPEEDEGSRRAPRRRRSR